MKEAAAQGSGAPVSATQSVKEGSIFSSSHDNTFQSPDTSLLPLQSTVEGSSEKVPEDGYNWRKYGRKQVKGNEFIRSYYRCTRPNCPAKRQLERSHDGRITDTTYFGQHDHPKPHSNIPTAVAFDVTIIERRSNVPSTKMGGETAVEPVHTTSRVSQSDYVKGVHSEWTKLLKDKAHKERDLEPKRRKKDNDHAAPSPIGEPRVVVHTQSEVDIVNDGYRWRKYGQKLVKGNENPRSYYRCSSPGCPAKKHVERASYDAKVVINTYEGQHSHDLPPSRTITQNIGVNIHATTHQPESEAEQENNAADLSAGENTSKELVGRSDKQVRGEETTRSEVDNAVTHPAKDSEFRSLVEGQQNGKADTVKEGDSVSIHDKVITSVPNKHEIGGDLQTQTAEKKVVSQDIVTQDISDFERNKDERETSTTTVFQS